MLDKRIKDAYSCFNSSVVVSFRQSHRLVNMFASFNQLFQKLKTKRKLRLPKKRAGRDAKHVFIFTLPNGLA